MRWWREHSRGLAEHTSFPGRWLQYLGQHGLPPLLSSLMLLLLQAKLDQSGAADWHVLALHTDRLAPAAAELRVTPAAVSPAASQPVAGRHKAVYVLLTLCPLRAAPVRLRAVPSAAALVAA